MARLWAVCTLAAALCLCRPCAGAGLDEAEYTHGAWLDSDGQFHLRWAADDELITFGMSGKATGYIALGLGPTGSMRGADMAIVWIDDQGAGHISDRHGESNGYPPVDAQQDWQLHAAGKNGTHMWARVSRKRNTCDKEDMRVGAGDTVRALWATSDSVPADEHSVRQHSARGSRSLHLFYEQQGAERLRRRLADTRGARTVDLHVDKVAVPHEHDTLYWCRIFHNDRPQMHVVAYDVYASPESNRPFLHHLILYNCDDAALAAELKTAGGGSGGKSWAGPCFPPDGSEGGDAALNPMRHCQAHGSVAGWAYGGDAFIFPDGIGQPVFGESKYYMLEMHYDNPNYVKDIVDNSGVRLYVTETLEPIVAQQALFGMGVDAWNMVIPPGQKEFTLYSYCPSSCSSGFVPEGHTAFAGMMHTHLAGRRVRLRHVRNGVELPPVMADEHYDFNYQQTVLFDRPVTMLPGDEFVFECTYDTSARQGTTFGGPSTRDEMCLGYVNFYPAIPGQEGGMLCISGLTKEDMMFGFLQLPNLSERHYGGTVLDPSTNEYVPVRKYVEAKTDWHKGNKAAQLQDMWRDYRHGVICNGAGYFQILYENKTKVDEPYVDEDNCGGAGAHSPIRSYFMRTP